MMRLAVPVPMKRPLSGLCLLWCSASLGQSEVRPYSLSVVGEHRTTPALVDGVSPAASRLPAALTSQEKQITGNAVGLDLSRSILRRKLELSYGFRIRYDHLFFETQGPPGPKESKKAWMNDHLFFLTVRIPFQERHEMRASVGVGLMNNGSEYYRSEIDTLPSGQVIVVGETRDFRYTAYLASLGYASNGFEIGALAYYCRNGDGFEAEDHFVLPAVFVKYRVCGR